MALVFHLWVILSAFVLLIWRSINRQRVETGSISCCINTMFDVNMNSPKSLPALVWNFGWNFITMIYHFTQFQIIRYREDDRFKCAMLRNCNPTIKSKSSTKIEKFYQLWLFFISHRKMTQTKKKESQRVYLCRSSSKKCDQVDRESSKIKQKNTKR